MASIWPFSVWATASCKTASIKRLALVELPSERQRLALRDESDWPILAAALALRCPIWTEDTDFFGCGVATWTTLL
ncbi:MAG: hypothetical protein EXQ52_00555 [Bryobacterales bacterium]|nr:hypothetical protein [Bryobacterales bacterium]